MARGIEHREKDTVIKAYEFGQKPNWALFSGTEPVVCYEGGDMTDGANRLDEYLTMLESSPTKATFILRVYNSGTDKITNKTPYSGSTTMMLNSDADVTTDSKTGLTIIDRGSGRAPAQNNSELYSRLDKLETANQNLIKQLHEQQLKNLEDKFDRAISGLQDNKPDPWEKILDVIANKPEIIPDTIGKLVDVFTGRVGKEPVNYVHSVPLNGTETKEEPAAPAVKNEPMNDQNDTTEVELTEEEENALYDRQEAALDHLEEKLGLENITDFLESLKNLPDVNLGHWVQQQDCLAKLSLRLQPDVITKMMQTVTALSDKDLNKLLNHLD